MKPGWLALAVICALILFGQGTFGQTMDKKSFETKMYSIEAISHFGLDEQKFGRLKEAEKRNLVESRDDLMAMLQAIQTKRDAMAYATSSMVHKYGSSTALASSLLEPETSILAAGVSDFAFVDAGSIRLRFFVAVFSEGNIVISEKSAILKKTDSGWRVAGFE